MYKAIAMWLYKLFYSTFEIGIGDIFLQRGSELTETQFISISRYLDIVLYYDNSNSGFPYKNTICKIKFGERHKPMIGDNRFRNLIASFESNGFDSHYPIVLDNHGYLRDGNHRCGLCLYHGIEIIRATCKQFKHLPQKTLIGLRKVGIPESIIEDVNKANDEIQRWLIKTGNTFAILATSEKQINNYLLQQFLKKRCKILRSFSYYNVILIQFAHFQPHYKYKNELVSMESKRLYYALSAEFKDIKFKVSKSCFEGHQMVSLFMGKYSLELTNTTPE